MGKSGLLPSSSGLLSNCFKFNAKDVKLNSQLETYGIYKQADARSTADQRAHNFLELTTNYDGKLDWLGMLWADETSSLQKNYYSPLA